MQWHQCQPRIRVCYESHDDDLMDAVSLELQIQIRVGETTGIPMQGHDFARLRLELAADLATSRAVFEPFVQPRCLLDGRNVLPSFVFKRFHTLPPSEMKSLYGSMRRSAVISLSYFRFAMFFPPAASYAKGSSLDKTVGRYSATVG